jgi:hypothetical protein
MTIQNIITTIGIPVIVAALIYIGCKLQTLDNVEKKIESIYDRFLKVEERVDTLWKDKVAPAHSPRQLNELGVTIRDQSGIKEIIDTKRQTLLDAIREQDPKTPYDAERVILSVVNDLSKHCPEVVDQLKEGAFKVGQSIDVILLVGGFYLRDQIFPELGFSLTDLDIPKPAQPSQ